MAPTSTAVTTKAERCSLEELSAMRQTLRDLRLEERNRSFKPLSPQEVSKRFQQYIQVLDQPQCHQALKNAFDLDHNTRLTQCICLGLGPFAHEMLDPKAGGSRTNLNRPLHQLALLTVILKILGPKHSIQKIYFQDPIFTNVERAFLQSLGYTILQDPAAFQHMSTNTFLFAPFLDHDVAAKALTVAFPALFIGNGPAQCLEDFEFRKQVALKEVPGLQKMVSIFHRFKNATIAGKPLPSFQRDCWTKGTAVRWLSPALEKGHEGRK